MGVRIHLGKTRDGSGAFASNSTSLNNTTEGSQDILIIGGIVIVLIMVFWLVCCILVYKKKIFVGMSQRVKNSLKNCRHRNPSGNSTAYFNHGSPYDQPNDNELILPVINLSDQPVSDPAQERLPT